MPETGDFTKITTEQLRPLSPQGKAFAMAPLARNIRPLLWFVRQYIDPQPFFLKTAKQDLVFCYKKYGFKMCLVQKTTVLIQSYKKSAVPTSVELKKLILTAQYTRSLPMWALLLQFIPPKIAHDMWYKNPPVPLANREYRTKEMNDYAYFLEILTAFSRLPSDAFALN